MPQQCDTLDDIVSGILEHVTADLSGRIGEPDGAYLYRMALNNLGAALARLGSEATKRE